MVAGGARQLVVGGEPHAAVAADVVEQFAQDRKNNLYKLWNRMSSGSYFPSPVRMVEIPKDGGRGTRVLGVPCVADRVAQASWRGSDVYSNQKMETPVTYFYAPSKMTVSAKVAFPKGILTQWFPYVRAMKPYLYYDGRDPWLSTSVTPAPGCEVDYAAPFHDGELDWS